MARFEIIKSGIYHTLSAREGHWCVFREGDTTIPECLGLAASVTDGKVVALLELVKVIREPEA